MIWIFHLQLNCPKVRIVILQVLWFCNNKIIITAVVVTRVKYFDLNIIILLSVTSIVVHRFYSVPMALLHFIFISLPFRRGPISYQWYIARYFKVLHYCMMPKFKMLVNNGKWKRYHVCKLAIRISHPVTFPVQPLTETHLTEFRVRFALISIQMCFHCQIVNLK